MRYLAQLLADPGREFYVLDLIAAESSQQGEAESGRAAGLSHTSPGDAGEMLDARAKDAYRRRLAEIDDDIEQARALEELSERHRQTPSATSSSASCRAPSASAAATDGPPRRPSGPESA